MISFDKVHKSFGKLEVLKGIDLQIPKGQVVTLIGPSGSGKSTILRCINGLEMPTSGTVTVDGVNITDPKADIQKVRRNIGMVFQHFNLFPHMTVMENMIYAPTHVAKVSKEEAQAKAMKLLELVGLTEKADAYPNKLSGGQKQRIAIARVFLKNPSILILDEATSALDNESEILVGQSLEKLAHGRTTLTIAHRLTTIKDYDRILVLGEEGIVESGTHEQLLAKQGVYYRLWNQLPGEDTL